MAVWDAANGEKVLNVSIDPLTGRVSSVAFAPDGSTIITAGPLSSVYRWDAATGEQRRSLQGHTAAVTAVAFAPDGATLATAGYDWTARLWDTATGSHLATLASHNAPIRAVAFSRDGLSLATCGDDDRVLLWDTSTGRGRGSLPPATGEARPKTLAFSPDGKTLVTGAADGMVRLWNSATLQPLTGFKGRSAINAVAFNPDGSTLFAAEPQGSVHAWSIPSGEPVAGPAWPNTTPQAMVLDPSGRSLAVALADATVRLWDVAGRAEMHTLRGHSGAVLALAFSPDGKSLATAAADRTVRIWDALAGQLRGTLEGHSAAVLGVAFSPDGRTLASVGADRVVKLWRGVPGPQPAMSLEHSAGVNAVAYAPDGQTVASAGSDKGVMLWEIARFKPHGPENPLARSLMNPSHRRHRDLLAERTRDSRRILEKLEEPISMSFVEETPLEDILRYITQATTTPTYSGIPIYVDPAGLEEAEKTMASAVRQLDIEDSPLKRTLQLLLSQLGLTYRVADGRLTITSQNRGEKMFGATIEAPRQSVNLDNPRARRVISVLEQPIEMKFGSGVSLEDLLKYIKTATITPTYRGIPIYVDPIGLQEAQKTMRSEIKYDAEGVPLRQSLYEILKQLRMRYVVGEEFVTITSEESEPNRRILSASSTNWILDQPIELSFVEPTALGDVIEVIRAATKGPDSDGLGILYFGEVGSQTTKGSYESKGKPLRESLKEILTPLGLKYVVEGASVLIVSEEQAGVVGARGNSTPK